MSRWKILGLVLLAPACAPGGLAEPSLAPRAAETIDPRLPVPDKVFQGTLDAELARRLGELVGTVRSGVPVFNGREAEASRLAGQAGGSGSESWIAAQQSLSRLVEQYGVTTRAAADIDELASSEVGARHWIEPADREAIVAAAREVAEISKAQSAAIDRITAQLQR
ncbi:MAG: hypothetical protein LOX97_07385 [Sphingomonas sp.]|nr:hypothetical protein [Sphingomonas sp.]